MDHLLLCLCFTVAMCLSFIVTTVGATNTTNPTKIIAEYYSNAPWVQSDRKFFPWDMDLTRVTHVFYGDFEVSDVCEVKALIGGYYDFQKVYGEMGMNSAGYDGPKGLVGSFRVLNDKLLSAGLSKFKLVASIGGWNFSRYFSQCVKDPTMLSTLVASIKQFLTTRGFDGVVLRWQWPGGSGKADSVSSDNDFLNYKTLLERVKTAVGSQAEVYAVQNMNPMVLSQPRGRVCGIGDYTILHAYDYARNLGTTGLNAPIGPLTGRDVRQNIMWGMGELVKAGCSADKMILEIAASGPCWSDVEKGNGTEGLFENGKDECKGSNGLGVVRYYDVFDRYLQKGYHWSTGGQVPYYYNNGAFVSFEDERSVWLKAKYARDSGLAGVALYQAVDDKVLDSPTKLVLIKSLSNVKQYALLVAAANGLNDIVHVAVKKGESEESGYLPTAMTYMERYIDRFLNKIDLEEYFMKYINSFLLNIDAEDKTTAAPAVRGSDKQVAPKAPSQTVYVEHTLAAPMFARRRTSCTDVNPCLFYLVADLDKNSAVRSGSDLKFKSHMLEGSLYQRSDKTFRVVWENPVDVFSTYSDGKRGMELSEAVLTDEGRLYSMDDRTGMIFEIRGAKGREMIIPRQVISAGNGDSNKGMKIEWATVKDGVIMAGSFGREFVDQKTGSAITKDLLWVVSVDPQGVVKRYDWEPVWNKIRTAVGGAAPGYVTHEAVTWSPVRKSMVFLPRRISTERYNEVDDEQKGANVIVEVDESFTKYEVRAIKNVLKPERGFSSFKFLPGSQDEIIVAIRSEEKESTNLQRSYLTVFDIEGKVLMEDVEIPHNYKFEGLEFISRVVTGA